MLMFVLYHSRSFWIQHLFIRQEWHTFLKITFNICRFQMSLLPFHILKQLFIFLLCKLHYSWSKENSYFSLYEKCELLQLPSTAGRSLIWRSYMHNERQKPHSNTLLISFPQELYEIVNDSITKSLEQILFLTSNFILRHLENSCCTIRFRLSTVSRNECLKTFNIIRLLITLKRYCIFKGTKQYGKSSLIKFPLKTPLEISRL